MPGVDIWQECLRVLRPGGHLLAFAGTRTHHRMCTRIEDAGFEIRDMIAWVYSGFPKSHNGPWGGTALKPALEPITMARKPLIGTVAANVQAHGTGALNIDGCRIGDGSDRTPGGAPIKNPAGSQSIGGGWANNRARATGGRWPANLIHDGSDEALAAFPVAPGQLADASAARFFKQLEVTDDVWLANLSPALIAGRALSLQNLAGAIAQSDAVISALPVGIALNVSMAPSMSVTLSESRSIAEAVITAIPTIASAFWQELQPDELTLSLSPASVVARKTPTGTTTITANLSRSDGSVASITFSTTPSNLVAEGKGYEQSRNRLSYCAKASRKDRNEGCNEVVNTHSTVKPTDLMRYLCRLVTPPGGLILDPFMGSGSTGKAAIREGYRFVGIERDDAYFAIAKTRVAAEADLLGEPA